MKLILGVLTLASASFAQISVETQSIGVRLRDANLNRYIECEPFEKGTRFTVKDRKKLDSSTDWWLEVEVLREGCPSSGFIREEQTQNTFRKDEDPNAPVLQMIQRAPGKTTYEVFNRVTIRESRSQVLEVAVDLSPGARISFDPSRGVGRLYYRKSSGEVAYSNSGWIQGILIHSAPGLSQYQISDLNRRKLYISETHMNDVGSGPLPGGGGNSGGGGRAASSAAISDMRGMAGHGRSGRAVLQRSRGLYRFPMLPGSSTASVCGSFHYLPDAGLVDAYVNKKVGWTFLDVLQTWRQGECRSNGGCRASWGDISHKTRLRWNGHKTHTYGHCIDLRPMRSGSFRNAPLRWQNRGYSRQKTRAFLRLLKRKGATKILFNDPQLIRQGLSRRAGGHDNHIHVCFQNNRAMNNASSRLSVSSSICSQLSRGRVR